MIKAPVKKRAVVDATWRGEAAAIGAARRVENKHGKKR
jgi:hypothetical protein